MAERKYLPLDRTVGGLDILGVLFRDVPEAMEILDSAKHWLTEYKARLAATVAAEDEDPDEADPFTDAVAPGEADEDFWDDFWPLDG